MIKMLEDLLIEATTNPNVPGSLVAGLRKAVDAARGAALPPWPRRDKDGKVYDLPGAVPAPHSVCVVEHHDKMGVRRRVGDVLGHGPNVRSFPLHWLPCDKDGWVASSHIGPMGLKIEWRDGAGTSDWRPAQLPQVSAIDEMAEQMKRGAAPTREDFDKAIDGLSDAMGVPKRRLLGQAQEAAPALAVQVAADPPYRVCIKAHETNAGNTVAVGHVVTLEAGDRLQQPDCWAPCDKDGWVSGRFSSPAGLATEWRGHPGLSDWRPTASAPQVSAIDEMAEQMQRWAAPMREPVAWFDKDGKIQGLVSDEQLYAILREALADLDKRNRWAEQEAVTLESVAPTSALAVQEGGSHYKSMKIQPAEYIHANGLGYFEGNVVKYVSRWRAKGGLQDLKKARHYLDLLTELEGDTK